MAEPSTNLIEGGCLCRDIRYRIRGATLISATCECQTCRKASAAAIVPWIHFDSDHLEFVAGKPVEYRSSADVTRTFCGRCGTPLTYRKDDYGKMIDVTVCSLDEPDAFPPVAHCWTSQRLGWIQLDDGLPCFEEGPPS